VTEEDFVVPDVDVQEPCQELREESSDDDTLLEVGEEEQ